jgi:hypothetical protein
MKYLHKPVAKRQDKLKDFKQKNFTALYKDMPASEIPEGGVSEAKNVLLQGEEWTVRPGLSALIVDSTNFPTLNSYSAVSKSGDVITSTSETFADSDVGNFFRWVDGTFDLIIAKPTSLTIQVDNSTANAGTTGTTNGRINASHWFEKTKEIFVLLGQKIYYIGNDIGSWTQVYTDKDVTITNTKSKFEEFEDSIYLRNETAFLRIDTRTTPYNTTIINTTPPTNYIAPNGGDTYPGEEEETIMSRFGRRYLYSMTKLDGDLTNDRADGTRIIKESGVTIATDDATEARDYAPVWKRWYFGNGVLGYEKTYVAILSSRPYVLFEWFNEFSVPSSFLLPVDTNNDGVANITKEVVFQLNMDDFTSGVGNNWRFIEQKLQAACRSAFPEYKYLTVNIDTDNTSVTQIWIYINEGNIGTLTPLSGTTYKNMIGTTSIPNGNVDYIYQNTILGEGDDAAALRMPSTGANKQRGWTHYSIYSTLTLGPEWRVGDNDTRNPEYYIWNYDVPVVSVFKITVDHTAMTAVIASSRGQFIPQDIGAEINLKDNLGFTSYLKIIEYVSSTSIKISSSTLAVTGTVWGAIGADGGWIRTALANNTNSVEQVGSQALTSSDLYKTIYWDDGTVGLITDVDTVNGQFDCTDSPNDNAEHGYVVDPFGRNYNDIVSDEVLEARQVDFPLVQRFWQGLPDGDLMSLVPGFMCVADEDATKFYYCNLSIRYQYLAGHYNALYQYDMVKDAIKELTDMPNQLIIFCANSTWREQINVSETITDDRVGESITVLSGLGVVDKFTGIVNRSGIADFATGQKAVYTNEPGIRLFDGYKYGPNLLYDEKGNSYINTEVEAWRPEVLLYYEPNLYGLMIFATKTTANNKLNGSFTKSTVAWRLALERSQGYGFSELSGSSFMFPEFGGGIMNMNTVLGNRVTVIFDESGYITKLSTRILSAAESNVMSYTDGLTANSGTEITWILGLREFVNSDEHKKMEYLEEFWYLRPQNESDKDGSGFDSYGFRDAQQITVNVYKDGNTTKISKVLSENPLATLYQPYNIQARRIKTEITGTTSSIRGIGMKGVYKVLEQREPPANVVTEITYKKELATDLTLWLSRGEDQRINRVTGSDPDTSQTIATASGPDALAQETVNQSTGLVKDTDSAFRVSGQGNTMIYEGLTIWDHSTVIFSFVWGFSLSGDLTAVDIFTIENDDHGSRHIYATTVGLALTIEVYSGNSLRATFSGLSPGKWYQLYMDERSIYLYDVDGLVSAVTGNNMFSDSSTGARLHLQSQPTNGNYFAFHDIRAYTKTISLAAFQYLNKDIYLRNGYSLLPPFTYVYSTLA